MYNKGITINVNATKTDINYIMGKHNIYWPIPEKAIVSNGKAPLYQNYGYDGYDPNVQIWETYLIISDGLFEHILLFIGRFLLFVLLLFA